MDHNDLYAMHCKPAFEALQDGIDEIVRLLKGSNGDAGLTTKFALLSTRVDQLESVHKKVLAAIIFLVSPVWVQVAGWLIDWLRSSGTS